MIKEQTAIVAKLEKPLCPKCGRKTLLFAKRLKEFTCRGCGHIFNLSATRKEAAKA